MEEIIKAKDVAETAVIVLLKGIKCRVAVRNDEGKLELKNRSIITQFLNPNNERKKMTKKIADTLSDTFEYYIENSKDNYKDICARTIIFIYAVSNIDLTYLHFIAKSDIENVQKTLTGIVDEIFHTFVGKASIKASELENLVYTKKFGEYWNIKYNIKKLSLDNYYNFIDNNWIYDIGKIQIDEDWKKNNERISDMFSRYGNCLNFQKKISFEDFESQIMKIGKKAEDNIKSSVQYILDLISADSVEVFNEKYGVAYNPITESPIKSTKWKEDYLSAKFGLFGFTQHIRDLICCLRATNSYIELNSKITCLLNHINDTINNKSISEENTSFFESDKFKEIKHELEDGVNFIQIQTMVNKELGTFGSCHYKMNSVRNFEINEVREFVSVMVEYLFYGVSSKIGVVNNKGEIKEKHDDTIYLYISGNQKKFTKKVKEALYYRIKYHLDRNEYFFKLLWQMFYYVFGVDFYMINKSNKNDSWLLLIDKALLFIEKGKSMNVIEKYIRWQYDIFQYESEEKYIFHFTPEEIDFFRKYDAVGYQIYNHIFFNLINIDTSVEVMELKNETIMKYIQIKTESLLAELNSTVKFIEELLKARSPGEFLSGYKQYYILYSENKINWKYKIYCDIVDEDNHRITMNKIKLEELMKFIAVYVTAVRIQGDKFKFDMGSDILWTCMEKLLQMPNRKYDYYYNKSNDSNDIRKGEIFDKTNMGFLDSDEIRNLYTMTKMMYKYIRYSEWIDKNMRLTK
ncbi:MAG: hypothetical protein K2K89_13865 [Ruminococcus sp.]|nr:hypothetical protein [Ruminococcus sp.]